MARYITYAERLNEIYNHDGTLKINEDILLSKFNNYYKNNDFNKYFGYRWDEINHDIKLSKFGESHCMEFWSVGMRDKYYSFRGIKYSISQIKELFDEILKRMKY
jgi:hypothetical protein